MEVLTHPMLDQLARLGLTGMAQAFAELEASGEGATLTHTDWLGLLVDREMTHRRDKRLAARLRYAKLRHQAVVEDIDYRAPRGLDRGLFNMLADGEFGAPVLAHRPPTSLRVNGSRITAGQSRPSPAGTRVISAGQTSR
jgi:DNA replication protein DnaC